jgi:hypothetical protein
MQKMKILQANRNRNGTMLKSDVPQDPVRGALVVQTFSGTLRNVAAPRDANGPLNRAEVDHIKPYDAQGSNSYCNARVISQELNEALMAGRIEL